MIFEYVVDVPDGVCDLRHIAQSGQTFRSIISAETITFRDGNDWYETRMHGPLVGVRSNRPESDFASFLRLDFDFKRAYQQIVHIEPQLSLATARCQGLRMLRQKSLYEVIVSFLCSPMKGVEAIDTMVCHVGSYAPEGFPDPDVVGAIPVQELRNRKLGFRSVSVVESSLAIVERGGSAYLGELRQMPYEDAWRELQTLRGIGRKVADCICLYGLDHQEAVPFDTHVVQAYKRLWPQQPEPNPANLKGYLQASDFMRDKFGKLAGLAQQLMFVDNMERYRNR